MSIRRMNSIFLQESSWYAQYVAVVRECLDVVPDVIIKMIEEYYIRDIELEVIMNSVCF